MTPASAASTLRRRPVGTSRPSPTATTSTKLKMLQARAIRAAAMIVHRMARPIGDGGVSEISSAAGRNSFSR
ncbi:hypothetical protein, partial [Brevundimonas sp. UBA6550]|uniref:hypothetical protein n=1 Tax=Brevundimonas sp. UBA6550 TaxID=1946135 RepID=UPI0025BD7D6E